MAMDIFPKAVVGAPATAPSRYGLYSAATLLDEPNGHLFGGGVQYESLACGPDAQTWSHACGTPLDDKVLGDRPAPVGGDSFWVFNGFDCLPDGDPVEAARQSLALREQRAVERTFWTGDQINDPHLSDVSAVIPAAGVQSLVTGLGILEEYLGLNYDGIGVIHAPRRVASVAAQQRLIVRDGDQLLTPLDNVWAFGQGYANTDPDGNPAAAGSAWLYATGTVTIRRGPVRVPSFEEALNRTNNTLALIAERPIIITSDCILVAVNVNISCDC